jgi:hypothetical protein
MKSRPRATVKWIAPGGQEWLQTPHPMQVSAFTLATSPASSDMAPMGQSSTQIPHPVQDDASTTARYLLGTSRPFVSALRA